jgi:hypothetical protein
MAFWNQPLSNGLMSSGFATPEGFPGETFDGPSGADLDDNNIPDFLTDTASHSEFYSNTGDLFQGTHTMAEGYYQLGYLEAPGVLETAQNIVPAAGSSDLTMPRNTGGIPGTNRTILSDGPVTGTPDNQWTNHRTSTRAEHVGLNGPVIGGADTGHGVANAYYAQQNAMYSQANAEAALMAAI